MVCGKVAEFGGDLSECVVVDFKHFRTLDAAVERDSVADGVLGHRLPERDERGEHVGLDVFTPRPLVGLEKHILSDQLGDFLAGHTNADDLVVA